MNDFLIFLGCLAGLILFAVVFSKIKGGKAWYTDTLQADTGEQKLNEEHGADFHAVPELGQAAIMSFARLKRTHVIFTDRRIVVGQKALFGKRYLITHMLYYATAAAPAAELAKISGGLYSKGYQIWVTEKSKISEALDGHKTYLKIWPVATASATNIEHCRLYSDHIQEIKTKAGFP